MFSVLVGGGLWCLLLLAGSTTALSLAWALVPIATRRFAPPRALQALSPLRCAATVMPTARSVQYVPCTLRFDQVTVTYPDTPWRRLSSAVPYRECALNVSLVAQSSDLLLITGDSSSGKSTLLQLIATNATAATTAAPSVLSRKLQPTSGTVSIGTTEAASTHSSRGFVGIPVYLNQKPTLRSIGKSSATVKTLLLDTVHQCHRQTVAARAVMDRGGGWGNVAWNANVDNDAIQFVLGDLMTCVGWVTHTSNDTNRRDTVWTKALAQLSVSELYRLALVQACLQSLALWLPYHVGHDCDHCIALPAPILLLDEWLDTEPSVVVQSVQQALEGLCRRANVETCAAGAGRHDVDHKYASVSGGGASALILSVTHYPQRWKPPMPRHGKESSTTTNQATVHWRRVHLRQGQVQTLSPRLEGG
jgi:energy-coupling factor transporter ATP-binding protein EcfA2